MPTRDESASFRFSTDDLPEAVRAKVVRELHEHAALLQRAPGGAKLALGPGSKSGLKPRRSSHHNVNCPIGFLAGTLARFSL
jgi:hypothetical protein